MTTSTSINGSGKFGNKDVGNLKWSGMIRRHFVGLPYGSCLIARCGCYEENKTYNNHDALIRHIERHHKSNPKFIFYLFTE